MLTDCDMNLYQSIREFLRVEVPREIQAVVNRGGIDDVDWAWLTQDCNDDPNDLRPINILMRADEYLLYPGSAEKHSRGLLVFRKIIALLSFVSGGVRVFGLRFSTDIDGFVEDEVWLELNQIALGKNSAG